MTPDLSIAMRNLADNADSAPFNRVFVWRQILTKLYEQGVEDGYRAAMTDRGTADLIADQEITTSNKRHERAAEILAQALKETPNLANDEVLIDHLAAVVLAEAQS
jgi:hypothetical protein